MEQQTGHRTRWVWSVGIGVIGLTLGAAFGGSIAMAQNRAGRTNETFTVQMQRIPNPDTSLVRADEEKIGQPDMFFYKVKDNANNRILYYMYYQGAMLAPLYTTGE